MIMPVPSTAYSIHAVSLSRVLHTSTTKLVTQKQQPAMQYCGQTRDNTASAELQLYIHTRPGSVGSAGMGKPAAHRFLWRAGWRLDLFRNSREKRFIR